MEKEKNRDIMNKNNYKKTLKNTDNIIFEYVKILHEYAMHIMSHMKIKDEKHYIFILKRGYDLLKNIFLVLIYYTNNIELVAFHLRKSYLYYTEFIGQIGEDSNSYLQLNSKDACLFVYKKTIYDINEEIKKSFQIQDNKKKNVELFKKKVILIDEIEKTFIELKIKDVGIPEEKIDWLNKLRINIIKIMEEINTIKDRETFEKIDIFLDFMKFKNFDYDKRSTLTYNFIKKITKKNISMDTLIKLPLKDMDENITPLKFLNKLFRK